MPVGTEKEPAYPIKEPASLSPWFPEEVLIMQNKLFLKAADICELLEVKQTSAYEIIGNLNKELEEQGYLTLRGKVPTKYFVKRFYGVEDTCEIPQEEGKEWFHA